MREIKFRAWDTKSKAMLSFVDEIVWSSDEPNKILSPHDCILMQYTGFIDKDSKEIYEGDIIRVLFGKQHIEKIFPVEWGVNGYHPRTLGRFRNTITVIGNKYENPELLE